MVVFGNSEDGKIVHCKYLLLSHRKQFSKALYGTMGGTCSARVFRPVIKLRVKKLSKLPRAAKRRVVFGKFSFGECFLVFFFWSIFALVIPYVQGASDRVGCILRCFNSCTALKPYRTLGRIRKKPKARPEDHQRTITVYKVKCNDHSFTYQGERSWSSRGAEHDPGRACKAELAINNTRTKN